MRREIFELEKLELRNLSSMRVSNRISPLRFHVHDACAACAACAHATQIGCRFNVCCVSVPRRPHAIFYSLRLLFEGVLGSYTSCLERCIIKPFVGVALVWLLSILMIVVKCSSSGGPPLNESSHRVCRVESALRKRHPEPCTLIRHR